MNRILLGALAALMFVAAGVFWWQGRAATERGAPPPEVNLAGTTRADQLPTADGRGMRGAPPPEAEEVTREQRRFDRFDRNRDSYISRNEMMSSRTAAFRALDTDGNNLLSFEEWAVHTSRRFHAADKDGDQRLTRAEFATTRPKPKSKPDARQPCRCPPERKAQSRPTPAPVSDDEDESTEFGDPDL
jgi:hypothetical protein